MLYDYMNSQMNNVMYIQIINTVTIIKLKVPPFINTSAPSAVHWFSLPRRYAHVGSVVDLAWLSGDPGITGEYIIFLL